MSDKRDLTRIEDLSEFIHELENLESEASSLPDFSSETLDPISSKDSLFESDFNTESDSEFGASSELDSDLTRNFSTDLLTDSLETETPTFENELSEGSDLDTTFTDDSLSSLVEETFFESGPSEKEDSSSFQNISESDHSSQNVESNTARETLNSRSEHPHAQPGEEYKLPENFSDLKKFSETSSFSGMSALGNPSFSVLIKNVRFIEDINDIITLLKELELLSDTEESTKNRLQRGTLLVSRISEYAAIYLAHKLRRFDIDIQVGLSDEIQSPKHQEAPETGIVSKFNLYQNQSHHFHFDDPKLELSDIIIASSSSLEGHQVLRYIGVASEHKMLEGHIVEDESSDEVPHHYQELAQKLKAHALKSRANAVVGLNYQLTPIPTEYGVRGHKYRLTCTGNLVWVNKL